MKSNRPFIKITLLALLSLSTTIPFHTAQADVSAEADREVNVIRKASVDRFLQINKVQTLGKQPVKQLQNITLSMRITDKGIIYTDEANGLIFTNAEAFQLTPSNELIRLDRVVINRYLDNVPDKIVVKAPNEKGVLRVFTDVTCGWCQKVNEDIPAYLSLGITLEFILFPREGIHSETALKMSIIQDATNQADALSAMMNGQYPKILPTNISTQLAEHYVASQAMQITSTPVMFYDGLRIDGYITPSALANLE